MARPRPAPLARRLLALALAYLLTVGSAQVTAAGAYGYSTVAAAGFVVDSTGDGADAETSDGLCDDGTSHCTLRAAIEQANATAGADTITFNLPGLGQQTIAPASALPAITDPVTIDGYTQPGSSANTLATGNDAVILVALDGAGAGAVTAGLDVTAGATTIRGLAINRFNGHAVRLAAAGGNTVAGNFIGTDAAGTVALANAGNGVFIDDTPNNAVGGTAPADRNLVGASGGQGVRIDGGAANANTVRGNYIGTNAAGTAALGVANDCVLISGSASDTVVGGTSAGAGNLISACGAEGVKVEGSDTADNFIQGNLIGTNAAGTAALGSNNNGVLIADAKRTTVGGAAAGARNVISANLVNGVFINLANATDNVVEGNFIGTNAAGTAALPNGADGVLVGGGSSRARVGGPAAGEGNRIAFNAGDGVAVSGSTRVSVIGNSIFSNGQLGLDLAPDGVTANDVNDDDAGANNLQNFPALDAVTVAAGNTTFSGTLSAAPTTLYTLHFYSSAACDASGNGEGETYLGTTVLATSDDGGGTFSTTINGVAPPPGHAVTATATDPAGNTSEFSACHTVAAPPPPTFTISGTVSDQNANPVGDVMLTLSDGATVATTSTNSVGGYSFTGVAGGASYTLTPSLANFSFTPPSRTYNNLSADQTSQDFTAAPNPAVVQFDSAAYSANESAAVVTVTLKRTGDTSSAVTINYADAPGTATAADYSNGSGSVAFLANETSKTFDVAVTNDALDEPDETFALALSVGAGNAVIGAQGTAAVTITDDDAPPSISVGDVTLSEGNAGQASAVFQIALSAASGRAVSVDFATADGTATAASGDYAAQAGTATLPAGTLSFAVSVPVNGDTSFEPDETFFLNLSAPANATLGDAQAQATVTNDDAAPAFSISGRVTNSANSQPLASVAVALSGSQSAQTTTDANGNYSFTSLAAGGNYTVTPSLANFTFAPPSRAFADLQANQTADFTAALVQVVISGRVADENGQAAGGVAVALLDPSEQQLAATQTDANGGYSFTAAVGGSYLVRPARPATIFTPPVHIFRNVAADQRADFTALDAFTVSGNLGDLVAPAAKGSADARPAADASGVLVTLSGTRSGTTLTDAEGNYTFANLPLGGTYRVTPQNPFNLFDPPFVALPDLGGDAQADFGASANPSPTPTPPIREDFTGATRDPDKFSLGTLTQPAGTTDPLVAVEQAGGQLVITPRPNFTGLSFNGYVTTRAVDFTNATASIEVDQIAAGGAQTIFAVGRDDENFFRFVAQEIDAAPPAAAKSGARPRAGALAQLLMQVRAAGVFNSLSIPYDPVAHRFWRFRHDAAASPAPAMFFEVSPTGLDGTWTAVRIVPVAGAIGALVTEISAGTAGAVASPGKAVFDNLNVVPAQTAVAVGSYRVVDAQLTVAESAGSFQVRVRRAGLLAGESLVDLAGEPFDGQPCATADGRARPRCDFSTTFARLRFAPGEAEKSVTVFVTNDVHAEGAETFRLALGNPSAGFAIDAGLVSVTITDDDSGGARNPINDADFFVRQQYLDFLSREPEPSGLAAWTNVLRRCAFEGHFGPGKSNSDPECDRIHVSSGFYRSDEFHSRGFFAYRFYEVALGRGPTYEEFLSDMQRLSGAQTPEQLEANKAAFARDFIAREGSAARPSFRDLNGNFDTAARLDHLLARANVTLADRGRLAADLTSGRLTPAQVLRAVAESDEVSARFYNRGFVTMQYFGYLQRDPEPAGFNNWLRVLDTTNDFRTMIFGFIYSFEYQSRFGPVQ